LIKKRILHPLWWAAALMSLTVSAYSHYLGLNAYSQACSESSCTSMFHMDAMQMEQLGAFGFSPELYGGLTVMLLAIQNMASWAVGWLLYWYGRTDSACIIASLFLIVTGTIFSADDSLFAGERLVLELFYILNALGSSYVAFLFLIPHGRFAPRAMAIPAFVWLGLLLIGILLPDSPLGTLHWPAEARYAYLTLMHLLVLAAQGYRYAQEESEERKRQIRWFAWGIGLYMLGGSLSWFTPFLTNGVLKLLMQLTLYAGLALVPFSIGVMMLESRLRHKSMTYNRLLVYVVLSGTAIVCYAMLTGAIALILQDSTGGIAMLLAAGFIAVIFQPLRERVQRAVNRLVFGEREDPYRLLSGLSEKLESALTHRTLLPVVVETAAAALRSPYAAIEVHKEEHDGDGLRQRQIAAFGTPVPAVSRLPLTAQGELVGELIVGIERLEQKLPPGSERMLADLLRQISIAVQAHQLTDELRRSRERLVIAREEERRRLRRDLHDGLGSSLASMTLRIDDALQSFDSNPERSKQSIETVQSQMRGAIADIRRLVYSLRPPTLDEFGLGYALRELAEQQRSHGMPVSVEGTSNLPPLPAAVEVAIYRIAQEALTNTLRHAAAASCSIQLTVEAHRVSLRIADNGQGMPEPVTPGVGLRSMKERAEELGGSCALTSEQGQGTVIRVTLPL
jgi:signal transduction histidine kinase